MRTRIAGRDCRILDAHFCLTSIRPSPTDLLGLTKVAAPRTRAWFLDAALLLAGWASMHAYRARDDSLTNLCIVLNRVYGWSVLPTVSAVCRATAAWKSTRAPAPPAAPWAPSVATRGQSSPARSRAASRPAGARPADLPSPCHVPQGLPALREFQRRVDAAGRRQPMLDAGVALRIRSGVSLASDQRACYRRA